MVAPPRQERWRLPYLKAPTLVVTALLLPSPAAGQAQAPTAANPVADSAQAMVTACAVVQAIRPLVERGRCRVERYRETRTEYILRVHEQAPPGAAPLDFGESEVRFSKTEPSVTVTRVPEL
jgi:hypothetical protein